MAKDDHHVIVCQILGYLYAVLKNGNDPDPEPLKHAGPLLQINKRYWTYIMASLIDYGFATGCSKVEIDGAHATVMSLERAQITPRGIEHLTENSFMQKAKRFLEDAEDVTPFV